MELSLHEVARLLNAGERQIRIWIEHHDLPHFAVRDELRFNREEILEWAAAHQVPVRAAGLAGEAPPRLSVALDRGGVFHDLPGQTPEEVLNELLTRLPLPPAVDRDLLRQMVVAREKAHPTGLNDGIAIPHAAGPLIDPMLEAPVAGLAFLRQPVDWRARDGKPVTCVFLLICPTVFAHLALLAQVANVLSRPEGKALLQARPPVAELVARFRAFEERSGAGGAPAGGPPADQTGV